jgi:hypothetical protein
MTALRIALLALLLSCSGSALPQAMSHAGVYKIGVQRVHGSSAVGSAVQIGPGKLITNCHTVRDATRIFILHSDGQLEAQLDKTDFAHDLCLLNAPAFNGRSPKRVPSAQLSVGQSVVAIGYGPDFRLSVAHGNITALYRFDGASVLRTTAWFPRGASGGGLYDEDGRLVGVLTFRARVSDELNYAVPVEWVDRILAGDLRANDASPEAIAFWDDSSPQQPPFLRAAWMEYQGTWQELRVLATDWVILQEDDVEAWIALGRARVGLRNYKEAIVAFRRAVQLQPNSGVAWYWLAIAYHSIDFTAQLAQASTRLKELDGALAERLSTELNSRKDTAISD